MSDSHSSPTTSLPLVNFFILSFLEMGNLTTMRNKSILEIGSGRGGGLSYITRMAKPDRAVGVDFARTQIDFCNQVHSEISGLEFLEGDAHHISALSPKIQAESFDYVLNVESSHCYGNIGVGRADRVGVLGWSALGSEAEWSLFLH